MSQEKARFYAGLLLGLSMSGVILALRWVPSDSAPVHYEHVADIPRQAGEATMSALVVEREPRPDGQRIMDQPAWTKIIGCPEPPNAGPLVFQVADDGFWAETQAGQYVPVTYFKYPGQEGQPPQYEFRGYAVQEWVEK